MLIELDFEKRLPRAGRAERTGFHLQVKLSSQSRRTVIMGPSASGKTLTLKAIAGLLRPDQGIIRIGDETYFDPAAQINVAAARRRVGYVFQDYALFPHLTVRQNIAFPLRRGWLNPPAHLRDKRVDNWLEKFHLHDAADQLPATLSGGQKQRTALARALVNEPRLLLLDEPFSALDKKLQETMRQELDLLLREVDIPMLLISHDPLDAKMFGDAVVEMADGRTHQTVVGASSGL